MAPAVGPLCWSRRGCSLYALFLVSLATYVYVRSTMTITNWAGWLLLAAEVRRAQHGRSLTLLIVPPEICSASTEINLAR